MTCKDEYLRLCKTANVIPSLSSQSDRTKNTIHRFGNLFTPFQKKTAYLEYMTTVGMLLGGQNATTQQHMRGILEFEEKLAWVT